MSLVKSYLRFDVSARPHKKIDGVKGIRVNRDGSVVARKAGVYFKLDGDSVTAFGSIGEGLDLSYSQVKDTVVRARGGTGCGEIVIQVFQCAVPGVTSSVKLAMLHHNIALAPPPGLTVNALDFQVFDKLVVKLSPYKDEFDVTFHIDSLGAASVACDASRCKRSIGSDLFRTRMEQLNSLISRYAGH